MVDNFSVQKQIVLGYGSYKKDKGLLNNTTETKHQFYVSNYTKSFEESAKFFFKEDIKLKEITLVD